MSVLKGPKNCTFNEPRGLLVLDCAGISNSSIRLTLGEELPAYFQFNILKATVNPTSTTFTDSVVFQTFRAGDSSNPVDEQREEILVASSTDTLTQIQMVSMASQVVGDENILQFGVQVKNFMPAYGQVQVTFPYYFKTSLVQDPMISFVECTDVINNASTSCSWNPRTNTVTLTELVGPEGVTQGGVL
jgi:hypothetical protein